MLRHKSQGRSGRLTLLLFVVAFAFLMLALQRNVALYDEGIIVVGAMRVASGEIPHRDFYANYGPASFYLLAGLFKLLGPSVLVERLWDTFVRALIATFIFLIVERCGARREAHIAYGVSLIWLAYFGFYGYPVFPALLFTLISVLFLIHLFQERPSALLLLASGASAGLTALFRYDVGFAVVAIETSVVAAYVLSQRNWTNIKEPLGALVRVLLPYSVGWTVVFLPVAVGYLLYAPLSDFVFDILYFPSQNYVKMRSLPFPTLRELVQSPEQAAVYAPIGAWVATLVVLFLGKENRRTECPEHAEPPVVRWILILSGALSIVFYLKGFVRVSIIHMAASIVLALAILAVVAKTSTRHRAMTGAVVWLGIFIAIVPTLRAATTVFGQVHETVNGLMPPGMRKAPADESLVTVSCRAPIGLDRIACFGLDRDRIDAIRFLQQHTQDDEMIFAGVTHHDKIFINDVMFYFAAKRRPVTKWHHFDPGLQTTAPIQNDMVSEFENKKPRFVVLESHWDDSAEPNASALSSGVTILDDYIRLHYEPVEQYGKISVLARRE